MEQEPKDGSGRKIGEIRDEGGKQVVFDRNGRRLTEREERSILEREMREGL